jgi:beta-fructofuranosidase
VKIGAIRVSYLSSSVIKAVFVALGSVLLTISVAPAAPAAAALTNAEIMRATAAVEAAAPRAGSDPARPIFHITAPAQWMNDPNGPIYHRGYYHVFYQLHPFSAGSGPKYWGHVRSRDLARWEHLPIALAPSIEAGEAEVWSGCCTLNGAGRPMIFYTSIARGKSPQTHAEQWAAIGDDNLIDWRKSPANPVLSEKLNEGVKIYDWRDPFIFRAGKRTFMVLGGNLNEARGGQAVVNIYEARNTDLTQWKYRGVLFQIPGAQARTAECPNFFKLGNRWVLFVSPYGKVQYFVGDFDPESCRFQPLPNANGLVDVGPNFYAPNTMQLPDGRRLVWGWINGFPGGRGWNGCLSVPRSLSLSSDGRLRQSPALQLAELRGKATHWRNLRLDPAGRSLPLPATNTLEIRADIHLESATGFQLGFKSGTQDAIRVILESGRAERAKTDADIALALDGHERDISLAIFVDRSVLEVFANETLCATKVISPLESDATVELQALGGTALVKQIRCWPMKGIW